MKINSPSFNDFKIKTSSATKTAVNNNAALETNFDKVELSTDKKEDDSRKKFSKKAAALIAGAAGLFTLAVFLIRKNQSSSLKHLAPEIEFKAAQTLEEAVKFGKKNLGIKTYEGFEQKDIDVLNWINEGFVNTSNKLKGVVRMPKVVAYNDDLSQKTTLAAAVPYSKDVPFIARGYFMVNKKIFSDIDSSISEIIESNVKRGIFKKQEAASYSIRSYFESPQAYRILNDVAAFQNGEITSFNDKVKLFDELRAISDLDSVICNSPAVYIKKILLSDVCKNPAIADNINISEIIEKLDTMSFKEQQNQLAAILKLFKKANIKVSFAPNEFGPFTTIYHEMGHLQDMVPRVESIAKFDYKEENYPKELKDWVSNNKDIQTANSISTYATYSPAEFIAETFARIVEKGKVSNDVMELYTGFNGPKIPV